jgi:hypothetical protein
LLLKDYEIDIILFVFSSIKGEDADENEAQLDEEMEKVFSEPNISKFDVRRLSDVKPPSSSKLDKEYQSQQAHSAIKYNEEDFDCKLQQTLFNVILTSAICFSLYSTSQEIFSTVIYST